MPPPPLEKMGKKRGREIGSGPGEEKEEGEGEIENKGGVFLHLKHYTCTPKAFGGLVGCSFME